MDTLQDTFPPIVDVTRSDMGLVEPYLIAEIANQGNTLVANLARRRLSYQDSIYGFMQRRGENERDST